MIETPENSNIDRPARDVLAELVAAYMKGEVRNEELEARLWDNPVLGQTRDPSVRILCDDLAMLRPDLMHPICVSRETWDWLLRVIALLRTDLELTAVGHCSWHRKQLLAGAGLLLVGTGLTATMACGSWLPLAAAWAAAGVAAYFYSRLRAYGVHPAIEALAHCAPFRSEAQRRNYQHLADVYGIPAYQEAVGEQPAAEEGQPAGRYRKWLILGALYGAVALPWMLGREKQKIHVVKA